MQPIRNLIDLQKLKSSKELCQQPELKKTTLSLDIIESVFRELSLIYGHLWTSTHPTVEMWEAKKRKWASALGDLKPEQLRKALDACHKHKHPPTLPEFLEFASGPQLSSHASFKLFPPALPRPVVNKEIRDKCMSEIRQKLRMGGKAE